MGGQVHISADIVARRYEAVVRISEALVACHQPEDLAKTLADLINEFLPFEYLDVLVFKENSTEIEWHACGKGTMQLPHMPAEYTEYAQAWPYSSQEPIHISEWNTDERFPRLKEFVAAQGLNLGSLIRVPLTTPHRRLGTLGVASAPGVSYAPEDVEFLKLIARVVGFAIDDGLNLRRAQAAQTRLQLLLDLTNRVTSNLELREVFREILANIREVMNCDTVGISIAEKISDEQKLYFLDFPSSEGILKEPLVLKPSGPGKEAFDSSKTRVVDVIDRDTIGPHVYDIAIAEGLKSLCFVPVVNRSRRLGLLEIGRRTEASFSAQDVEFLTQVAGQIAIAIENSLAYEEISELKEKLAQEKLYLEEEIRSEMNFGQMIGKSPALRHVLQLVKTVAPSDSTVLLLGETGTGKELIARAIHEHSQRLDRTFVKLNCAAIPTGLLESELFGHEKGAFTGAISQKVGRMELADRGTLFLDEVGDIPIEIQPKLLRALQEREFERLGSTHTGKVNVRLIAATNRDLEKMVADREFRSDLYYRLHVFPIRIPPLRERKEDIPLLASYFVQKFAKQMQKKIETISTAVMKGLTAWEWPGNIRELENFIERAVILTRGNSLEAPLSELRKTWREEPVIKSSAPVQPSFASGNKSRQQTDAYEKKKRDEIVNVLVACKGRVGGVDGAAARLGINRSTLLSRMRKLGIYPKQYA